MLNVIIYTRIMLGYDCLMCLVGFRPFTHHLTLNRCNLTSPTDIHMLLRHGARKEQTISYNTDHGQTVVPNTDRDER